MALVQGGVTALAVLMKPIMTETALLYLSVVGNILIFCVGINLVFGTKADLPMSNEQRLFLPEELMFYLSEAHLTDGTPLVVRENIAPFQVAPVPWYADCRLGLALFALCMIIISWWDRKRHKLSWWVDAILGIVYLILLTIVIFLTFFSVHPLVGFSWRLIILPLIHLCARLIYWLR